MQLTVRKSTEGKTSGFVITFATNTKTVMTPFGVSQTKSDLLFFKGDEPIEVGTAFDIDESLFEVTQLETETGTTNWIVFK
jgi:hypothetical protein